MTLTFRDFGENFIVVAGGDVFDVIGIEEAVCRRVVEQVIAADDEKNWAYDRALGDTTYGHSRLEKGSIDVHLESLSAGERFDPVYFSRAGVVFSETS